MQGPRFRRQTVFVFTGGANLGAVQVGMMRPLLEAGIRPDAVVGTSVGALNAVALAVDPTAEGLGRLEQSWRDVRRGDIFPSTRVRVAWHVARRRVHLHDAGPLRALIRSWLPIDDLSEAALPVHVVTTELASGRPCWWRAGPAVEVLAASCALPGVYPPVDIDGVLHVDGGVVRNVPVRRAADIGARRIVVLDARAAAVPDAPRSALGVLLQSFRAARQAQLEGELALLPPGPEVIWLSAELPQDLAFDDFSRTDELLELGRRAAVQTLSTGVSSRSGSRLAAWLSRRSGGQELAEDVEARR